MDNATSRLCPVCQAPIPWWWSICADCAADYGDPATWPEWLAFLVSDYQREIDYARNHDEVHFDHETGWVADCYNCAPGSGERDTVYRHYEFKGEG